MRVLIDRKAVDSLLGFVQRQHPNEAIFLLRGKIKADDIVIEEILLPPYGSGGGSFAFFPSHMLPIDFTIVGTAHSHPSGSQKPSAQDLNNFYSRVMVIFSFPYGIQNIHAYNSRGEAIPLVIESFDII